MCTWQQRALILTWALQQASVSAKPHVMKSSTDIYIKWQLHNSSLNSTVQLMIILSSCTNIIIEAGTLAYTERLGVTWGKGVVIAAGRVGSVCAEQFLNYDFFSASSTTTTPSCIYLRSLEGQKDGMNTVQPCQNPTCATAFIKARMLLLPLSESACRWCRRRVEED